MGDAVCVGCGVGTVCTGVGVANEQAESANVKSGQTALVIVLTLVILSAACRRLQTRYGWFSFRRWQPVC